MSDVCCGCPCLGTLDCLDCGEHNSEERYGEDGDYEHEENDGDYE